MGPNSSTHGKNNTQLSNISTDIQSRRFTDINLAQNCILIWLDSNISEVKKDCRNNIAVLQHIFNSVNTFTSIEQCADFLKGINDEKVFMITSGALGEQVVPKIHGLSQLDSIYIYCMDKEYHERWSTEWIKVKGVFTQMLPICEALEQTVRQYEQNTISISFVLKRNDVSELNPDQINQSFMYTLVLKDILLTIPFDKLDFKEFIDCCRDSYANNETELKIIDELEHKYHKDKSIWWYTREGFLYRVLNQALRSMDIDVIIIMGFFIQDLHNRIKKLHSKQFGDRHSAKPFVVYRGQVLSNKVFDQMEKANGGLVSFNSFLSTSKDHKVAEKFARRALTKEDSIGIIFVMTIDPSISSTPFASISNISYYQKENEILFSMHTVFLIDDIKLIDDNACLWQVNLTQTRNNAHQLCALTKRLRDEVKGFTGWDEFGRILIKLGQLKKAQEVYMAMLQKTSNDYDKANIYNQLGCIKDIQGENAESITFYKKSLEIIEENGPKDYSDTSYYFNLASSYNNIGVLYDRMGEYSDALLYHKKAFELRQKICHPLHPDQAGSYTNLGLSYKKMKDDSNALSSLQQALEIRRKNLPADHLDLAQSYLNLVSLFEQMGKHVEARSYCEKALAIQEKTLPSNHPALVKTRNYIKQISSKKTTSRDGSSD